MNVDAIQRLRQDAGMMLLLQPLPKTHLNLQIGKFRMKLKQILAVTIISCVAYAPIASAGLFDSLTDGIANVFDTSKQKLEAYKKSTDKQLVDQFYYLSEDGEEGGMNKDILSKTKAFEFQNLTPTSLTMSKLMYREANLQIVVQAMRGYAYSPMDDEIGQRYITLAQSRGNSIKLYKPALGGLLNKMLDQNFRLPRGGKGTYEWINSDNVLIEYSPSGQIVSVMTRSHQASVSFGVNSYQYTNFYFGPATGRYIENHITNQNFENNFIRVVSSTSSPAPVAQAAKPVETNEAIIAVAPVPPVQAEVTKPSSATIPEQRIQLLKNLGELRKSGTLTEQEFNSEKRKILDN